MQIMLYALYQIRAEFPIYFVVEGALTRSGPAKNSLALTQSDIDTVLVHEQTM